MPAIVIRNISAETHRALKRRAKAKGTSTEAEIRRILDQAAFSERKGLGTILFELTRSLGGVDLNTFRDQSPLEAAELE